MPKIAYINKRFGKVSEEIITDSVKVINRYRAQGYYLTVRQVYYQMIAKDLFPAKWIDRAYNLSHGLPEDTKNTIKNYKKFANLLSDARLAGLIDWTAIEDRTRNLHRLPTWDSPATIVDAVAEQFRIDKWETQPYHVEVWVEKEALAGVFERIANELAIPMFACRGYVSQSEMWSAAQRLKGYAKEGKTPLILHFGDHDPSGIDMTRDIIERLEMFSGSDLTIERVALNMDQIRQYNPPPNPAKDVDPRFKAYIGTYGDESWELDALEPDVLAGLVRAEVERVLDDDAWTAKVEEENEHRGLLSAASVNWPKVADFLNTLDPDDA